MRLTARAAVILAAAAALTLTACSHGPSVQQIEQQQQTQDTRALENAQPIPHYAYSQERAALITAQNIAAAGTQTTSFFFNMGSANPLFTCTSIGLGVPESASLSNPEQIAPISGQYGGGATTLPQMDPYGIYVPQGSTGTFVDCVNSAGKEYLVRWEGFVLTLTAASTWNYTTHQVNPVGNPTVKIKTTR
jgi:hypothetical protein